MTRRGLFNIAVALSTGLFVVSISLWLWVLHTHVSAIDRLHQQRDEIDSAITGDTYGTPRYIAAKEQWHEWMKTSEEYYKHEPEILAAEHRKYVSRPAIAIGILGLLPLAQLVIWWRRWEKRQASKALAPPTRVLRVFFSTTAVLAALSGALALVTAVTWVRSYSVSDRFFQSIFFDDGDSTFWRQTLVSIGRGSIGVCPNWQSGPKGSYKASIEAMYARQNTTLSAFRLHYTGEAKFPDFRFGPTLWSHWGFIYSYFEHGDAGLRPRAYAYELIVPLWSMEALSLALPVFWIWRWQKRRRRVQAGHCRECGYNLMGNTSGACPECGVALNFRNTGPQN